MSFSSSFPSLWLAQITADNNALAQALRASQNPEQGLETSLEQYKQRVREVLERANPFGPHTDEHFKQMADEEVSKFVHTVQGMGGELANIREEVLRDTSAMFSTLKTLEEDAKTDLSAKETKVAALLTKVEQFIKMVDFLRQDCFEKDILAASKVEWA